ncbi:MAG: MgtC/SapB family protein [Candidatus Hydrogenedentes bacterium]|nr:MgtC/SapB family protein [Candidatus Hydrogenedentota bacterium]
MSSETLEICIKFALALLLSGLLGLERERKGRAAGLRTHVVVCLGSTLAMIVSDLLAAEWTATGAPIWLDRGRIAAGIVTGIGFIGAGTIINVGSIHRGLTTAAMLWFVAVLGIAIGVGFYEVAVLGTFFALFAVLALERVSESLPARVQFVLSIRLAGTAQRITDIERFIEVQGYRVLASRLRVTVEDHERVDMTFDILSKKRHSIEELVTRIQQECPGALRVTIER